MKKFLLMTFLSTNILCLDKIVQVYPELHDFFEKEEIRNELAKLDFPIEVFYTEPINGKHTASFNIEIGTDGIKKSFRFNSYYIDRNKFSAEEFRSIFCHELGHGNDKSANKIPFIIFGGLAANIVFLTKIVRNCAKTPSSTINNLSLTTIIMLIEYLAFKKYSRDAEVFADKYSFNLTKDSNAAISALEKRKVISNTRYYKYAWLNQIAELFRDHPNEDNRIANIIEWAKF